MSIRWSLVSLAAAVAVVAALFYLAPFSSAEAAQPQPKTRFSAFLRGFNEVPSISTMARGSFTSTLSEQGDALEYELSYSDLSSDVVFAHIHLGKSRTNGGIMVFLCQTPAGPDPLGLAPMCVQDGTVAGVITADHVNGPSGQGITAGEFVEFIQALRGGAAYVNVHSATFSGGEIRGQIR